MHISIINLYMSYRIVFEGTKGHQFTLVQKVVVVILVLAVLSVISLPSNVFAASNNSNAKNKKGEASLELSGQFQDYPAIADVDQTGLSITGDMTISLWTKPTIVSENRLLVSKWNHVSKTSYLLFFVAGNLAITLSSEVNGYGYKTFSVPYTKNINEWAQITMVYTAASGRAEFFIDGNSVGKSADFAMPTSIANTDAPFVIGTRENQDALFEGNIDDVRIWSRSLTSDDISELYKHPKKLNNSLSLRGYWKFNGNLNDESGNGNNLSSSLSAVFSNDIPF